MGLGQADADRGAWRTPVAGARRGFDMGSGRARTLGIVAGPERLFCRVW